MKRFVPAAALVLSLIPFAALAEEAAKPAEPTVAAALAPLPFLGTPEPIFTSSCHVSAMTSCDNGHWLSCDGNVQCEREGYAGLPSRRTPSSPPGTRETS